MFENKLPGGESKGGITSCSKPSLVIFAFLPRFAPGHEKYPFTVIVQGLKEDNDLVGLIEGSGAERFDTGLRVLQLGPVSANTYHSVDGFWDGKDGGGAWAHPGLSLFRLTVHLITGNLKDQYVFEVVFARPQLVLGRPNPADLKLKEEQAARLRLNELGWYGGPLGADVDGYQGKAIGRFRRNHPDLREGLDAGLSGELWAKLEDPRTARPWLDGEVTHPGQSLDRGGGPEPSPLRVFVESAVYSTDIPLIDREGEYQSAAKHELSTQYDSNQHWKDCADTARLNRPLIPIECRLPLLDSTGAAVFVPGAVGPAEIQWTWKEPAHDPTILHDDDRTVRSFPHQYVSRAVRARLAPPRFNCHVDFGGLRSDGSILPFLAGALYPPYGTSLGAGGLRTPVAMGEDLPEDCRGMAGVYFRPSIVAGDQYWIEATVRFTNHPRAEELENACYWANQSDEIREEKAVEIQKIQPGLSVMGSTRRFQIWRHAKIRAVVGWPVRDWGPAWPMIQQEYARSYLSLEPPDIPNLPLAKVCESKVYETWRDAIRKLSLQFASIYKSLSDPDLLIPEKPSEFGMIMPPLEAVAKEARSFSTLVLSMHETEILILKTCRRVQVEMGHGLVIFDRLMIPRESGIRGDSSDQKSEGLPDGIVLIDQVSDVPLETLATHEIAHCFWLRHAKQVGDKVLAPDHDDADEYCMMRYPDWKQQDEMHHLHEKSFRPRFCGRCNLKLRGWKVLAKDMPVTSA